MFTVNVIRFFVGSLYRTRS